MWIIAIVTIFAHSLLKVRASNFLHLHPFYLLFFWCSLFTSFYYLIMFIISRTCISNFSYSCFWILMFAFSPSSFLIICWVLLYILSRYLLKYCYMLVLFYNKSLCSFYNWLIASLIRSDPLKILSSLVVWLFSSSIRLILASIRFSCSSFYSFYFFCYFITSDLNNVICSKYSSYILDILLSMGFTVFFSSFSMPVSMPLISFRLAKASFSCLKIASCWYDYVQLFHIKKHTYFK